MNTQIMTAAQRALQEAVEIDTPEHWRQLAERLASSHGALERQMQKQASPKAPVPRLNTRLSYGEACATYRLVPKWFGRKNAAGIVVRPKRHTFLEPRAVLVRFADGESVVTGTYFRAGRGEDVPDIDAVVRAERGARIRRECARRKIPATDVLMLDGSTKRLWLCEIPGVVEACEVPVPFQRSPFLSIGGALERPEFVPVPEQVVLEV
jgi:hypothetical protein